MIADVPRKILTSVVLNTERLLPGVITFDFFEDILASNSEKYKSDIRKSRADARAGKVYSLEEVVGDLTTSPAE